MAFLHLSQVLETFRVEGREGYASAFVQPSIVGAQERVRVQTNFVKGQLRSCEVLGERERVYMRGEQALTVVSHLGVLNWTLTYVSQRPVTTHPTSLDVHRRRQEATQQATRRQPLILIVDDSPTVRNLVQRLIESKVQARIVTASDGLSALSRVMDEKPALILLDIQLPHMCDLTADLSLPVTYKLSSSWLVKLVENRTKNR